VKYLLTAVLAMAFTNVMHAQQPTTIVSSAGNFSVSLPPGERKDENANVTDKDGEHAVFHSFGSIQYNKSFIVTYKDYSSLLDIADSFDSELKEAATKGVVTNIAGSTRQGRAVLTYTLTKKFEETQLVESKLSMIVGRRSYLLVAVGPIYDAPTSKEIADFFDSFKLLREEAH
jgi:hypothetical protein